MARASSKTPAMRAACAGLALALVGLGVSCEEGPPPRAPDRIATPACPQGPFALEAERLLPRLSPGRGLGLFSPKGLDPKIEPGCVLPFRKEPDERSLDVGLVTVKSDAVGGAAPRRMLGQGRLEIGRKRLRLRVDDVLSVDVDGQHVVVEEKGQPRFEGDVSPEQTTPLRWPLDALVAALDVCDDDLRIGRTEDGNAVLAERGSLKLWRIRWIAADGSAAVDTSYGCGSGDARLLWRTVAGELEPMLTVASARSERTLMILREAR